MARDPARSQFQQTLNVLATVAVAAFAAAGLYWARAILIPLALAILISFVLSPVVMTLQRRGLGRLPSVIVVLVASLLVMGTVTIVIVEQVTQLTKTLPDHADRIKSKAATVKGWISGGEGSRLNDLVNDLTQIFDPSPPPAPPGSATAVVVNPSSSWATRVETYFSPAAEALGQAAFTFILVVFMLLRREDLRNRAIRLLGPGGVTTTTKAVDETSRRISRYLLAQFLLNSAFGVVISIGLLIMGVPYAPLWGFIAFLMRYVPYIGTWIGLIPPALFTFAVSEGWGLTLGVIVLFLGLEALCNNFFEPMIYGPRLGLSEVAQLVATAFWAFLWGPVGMILAWPLTTCLLMLGKYVPQMRFLNVLLGDEPVLSPRLAFYQRLAARDQDEAAGIVEKNLPKQSIEQMFDDLLIPALHQARIDSADGLLSDQDLAFVTHAVEEIAEETVEYKPVEGDPGPRVPVTLIPAKDSVDHAAGLVLARLLEPSLWEVDVAPAEKLTSELLARVVENKPAIVVIISVAPGGLTHTRFLCKRLRSHSRELKVAVSRFAASDEENQHAAASLRNAGAEELTTTVEATRNFLQGWRTVFAAGPVAPSPDVESQERPGAKSLIGTIPA